MEDVKKYHAKCGSYEVTDKKFERCRRILDAELNTESNDEDMEEQDDGADDGEDSNAEDNQMEMVDEEDDESRLRETVAELRPSLVIANRRRFCISYSAYLTRWRYLWMALCFIWDIQLSSSAEGRAGLPLAAAAFGRGGTFVSVGVERAAAAAEALDVER